MNHEEYERMYRFEDAYWWFTARRGLITTLLSDLYPRDGRLRILDIGCGTGAMLDELAPFGSVTGADFSPEALRFCRTRGQDYPLTRADVRRLPFADGVFDVVTAMDIIEHIDDDKAACAEIRRVLKPGGRLLATVPAFPSLWSEHDEALHHFRRYTVPHLRDILGRVGFAHPRLSYTVTALFPPIWLYRQLGRFLPRKEGHEKKADLVNFSPGVNTLLRRLSEWETNFIRKSNLPFGVSVVCIAQKPQTADKPPIRKTMGGFGAGTGGSVKRTTAIAGTAVGAGAALLGYATLVEPFAVETVRLEISLPRLPPAFDGYTLYQVSDLHTRSFGRRERHIQSLFRALPPADIVALTGDMIHTEEGIAPFLRLAKSFRARDGVYAIFGNSEHKNGVRPAAFARTLAQNGITPLLNTHTVLTRDGAALALAGTDDPVSDRDDLGQSVSGIWQGLCTVLLMHAPDPIAEACVRGVDLVLSGHTHGGQVRFPLGRPPYTHSILGRDMSSGYYAGGDLQKLTGTRAGRTQLYVSRGIGISGLALRFLVRPEFTIITLRRGLPQRPVSE